MGVTTGASPAGAGEPTVRADGFTRGDTCHLDAVDRYGTLISATPSGGWLQSNPTIPELGFCLGTRLQMCWLEEGLPNSLTPGRRPRTTLSPTLAALDGIPTRARGTPGGDQQDQWSLHAFLRIAARHSSTGSLELQEAIDPPNWHTEALISSFWPRAYTPGRVVLEANHGREVADRLRARGHDVVLGEPWSEGRLSAVARAPETGILHAAANPRGMQGYTADGEGHRAPAKRCGHSHVDRSFTPIECGFTTTSTWSRVRAPRVGVNRPAGQPAI